MISDIKEVAVEQKNFYHPINRLILNKQLSMFNIYIT
jgi:hypothetical protein